MAQNEAGDRVAAEWLDTRLPPDVVKGLSDEQRHALIEALRVMPWKKHPVDLRMTIPFFGRRYYLAVIGGIDKRSSGRLKTERAGHPVHSMGNMMFVLGIAVVFYLIVILAIFFHSRLVEF
ncbi:MAG: hypothetical protein ABT940_04315 [Alphaproteobacteria bacterium]